MLTYSVSDIILLLTHPWVQISNFTSFPIFVGDLNMLMTAGMNHHVPWVAVQTIGPVVVTLDKNEVLPWVHVKKNKKASLLIILTIFPLEI